MVNEEFGDLSGIPVVEKTIEEYDPERGPEEGETARTVDIMGITVQYLDGTDNHDDSVFDEHTEIKYDGPVGVFSDTGCQLSSLIGHASLYVEGKTLKADLFINYHSPERLAIENGINLYPSVCGMIQEKDGDLVKKCSLKGVALTIGKNVDPRIEPLR